MLTVKCDFCPNELTEPGGLLFDPPNPELGHVMDCDCQWDGYNADASVDPRCRPGATTRKRHACVDCMDKFESIEVSSVAKRLQAQLNEDRPVVVLAVSNEAIRDHLHRILGGLSILDVKTAVTLQNGSTLDLPIRDLLVHRPTDDRLNAEEWDWLMEILKAKKPPPDWLRKAVRTEKLAPNTEPPKRRKGVIETMMTEPKIKT